MDGIEFKDLQALCDVNIREVEDDRHVREYMNKLGWPIDAGCPVGGNDYKREYYSLHNGHLFAVGYEQILRPIRSH